MPNPRSLTVRVSAAALLVGLLGVTGGLVGNCDSPRGLPPEPRAESTPPTVSATTPRNGDAGVGTNTSLNVTFSEAMDAATIARTNFTLAGVPAGTVTYDAGNRIATVTPIAPFPLNTAITATILVRVTDVAGNPLSAPFTWRFLSGTGPDSTPPTVAATTPVDGSAGMPINSMLTATFSEAMRPLTLTPTTFVLEQGVTSVPGTVTYADAGRIATFTPTSPLAMGAAYSARITTFARDLADNRLTSSVLWSFTTAAAPDATPPTVSLVSPSAGATGVPINTSVNGTFSEAMDPATLTTATFTLTGPGATPVAGTVSYVDLTSIATFTPLNPLAGNTTYTGRLTTGARDLAGNPLAVDFAWVFTSAVISDTTAPTVASTVPVDGALAVPPNSQVTATFSESMDPATLTTATFTVTAAGGLAETGAVTYADAGRTATFTPGQPLLASTAYTANLTTAVRDLAGNPLAVVYTWTFTTGVAPDTTPPTVTDTTPASDATNVFINQRVNATCSEPMDPATLTTATFTLDGPGATPVSGTVTYDAPSRIATFVPAATLAVDTLFTATLSTGVTDVAGNPLASAKVWTFTTGTSASQPPVVLASAGLFAVLAGATVNNIGNTTVNGDLGVSPGTAVVGFPPGVVNGTIHAGDPAAAQAQFDLTVAYNDAQGRSLGAISLPGNLGGLTLTPGLYSNAGTSGISGTGPNGILTLDAQGDSTAVFIFKMATTLITDSGTSVVLIGGAKATNVYWAVGTSATLGTTSVFCGSILADQSITLGTGATLAGRALARIAAVSLDANTVTIPSP